MFALWLAFAAVVPGSQHSISGAFGFKLGKAPGAEVSFCERNDYPDKKEMFVCRGDNFFKRIFVHTWHGQIVMLSGSRNYDDADLKASQSACYADLGPLKQTIERKYPKLLAANTAGVSGFKLTEKLYKNVLPIGRSIEGECKQLDSVRKSYVLWLTYTHSDEEGSRLRRLDDAERLKAKGLNPDAL